MTIVVVAGPARRDRGEYADSDQLLGSVLVSEFSGMKSIDPSGFSRPMAACVCSLFLRFIRARWAPLDQLHKPSKYGGVSDLPVVWVSWRVSVGRRVEIGDLHLRRGGLADNVLGFIDRLVYCFVESAELIGQPCVAREF